jgi:O-antigen ligase
VSAAPVIRAPAGAATVALAAGAAGLFLAQRPPSPLILAAVVALGGGLALAAGRYEAVVGLGFLALGVVKIEPAPSDGLLTIAIGVAFAAGRPDLRRVPVSMLLALVALLGLNLLSAIGAARFGDGMRYLAITLYLAVLAVWLATWATTPRRMRLVIGAYVAGAALSAAVSVLAVIGAPIPGRTALIGEGVRAQGLFKDPNVFGPYLVPAALILIEEALSPRLLRLRRATSMALLGTLVLGIIFAYSRAGWLNFVLGLVVMLAVLTARGSSGRRIPALFAIVLALAAVGIAAIALSGSEDLLRERARTQRYDSNRFDAQRSGLRLAETHVLGVGPGQFELDSPISAHSIYVRVMAEQGPLGLAALLVLLGGTLVLAARNAVQGRDAYGVGSAALLGAWCGLLANGAFVDTLHWRHLWLVAALVWVAATRPWYHGDCSRRT